VLVSGLDDDDADAAAAALLVVMMMMMMMVVMMMVMVIMVMIMVMMVCALYPQGGGGVSAYSPGDAIGVRCPNIPGAGDVLLARLAEIAVSPEAIVTVTRGAGTALGGLFPSKPPPVRELAEKGFDLSSPPRPQVGLDDQKNVTILNQ
jgi:hypothetical protein